MRNCRHGLTELSTKAKGSKRWCFVCKQYLSLGPSNDTPDVLIEIRAAEIAADEQFTADEYFGWLAALANWEIDQQHTAGWLAREIVETP